MTHISQCVWVSISNPETQTFAVQGCLFAATAAVAGGGGGAEQVAAASRRWLRSREALTAPHLLPLWPPTLALVLDYVLRFVCSQSSFLYTNNCCSGSVTPAAAVTRCAGGCAGRALQFRFVRLWFVMYGHKRPRTACFVSVLQLYAGQTIFSMTALGLTLFSEQMSSTAHVCTCRPEASRQPAQHAPGAIAAAVAHSGAQQSALSQALLRASEQAADAQADAGAHGKGAAGQQPHSGVLQVSHFIQGIPGLRPSC